ncbi:hypothetical protein EIP91_006434 [Steccherinum ochraceum]|uniref:Uncharacterized protein n=1 Tax=Steccherinum ochraceum TaxID=92696 RepID=A0A4R0R5W8_9APHY|nr:hypothetical protein EIP91_006434 [Steccherinum ochraceum]
MSTTASPTATDASTPSPSSSPTNGVLSSTGGAPLILVFLGAGLLVGAVFALLILRRFYPRRRRDGMLGGFGGRDGATLDEKPSIWDVQLESQGDEKDASMFDEAKWTELTPMSAKFIPDNKIPPPAPLPLITLDSLDTESGTPRTSRISGFRRHLPFNRSQSPSIAESTNGSASSFDSPTGGYTRNGKLQVAVAIGMPRPPSERRRHDGRGPDSELCLGLTEIPWDEKLAAKEAMS